MIDFKCAFVLFLYNTKAHFLSLFLKVGQYLSICLLLFLIYSALNWFIMVGREKNWLVKYYVAMFMDLRLRL